MEKLISVKIPTYNCAKYLEETLKSILNQKDIDLDILDIEVIDDCSSDNPEAIVNEIGQGRVKFYRNKFNLGATKNFNECIKRSSLNYVHILHGDDFVSDTFYMHFLNNIGNSDGAMYSSVVVDEKSDFLYFALVPENLNQKDMFYNNSIRTPGVIVKRDCYEKIGYFNESLSHVADWDMWMRLIVNFKINIYSETFSSYRYFKENDTSNLIRTGGNIQDVIKLIPIFGRLEGFSESKFKGIWEQINLDQIIKFKLSNQYEELKSNYIVWKGLFSEQNQFIYQLILSFLVSKFKKSLDRKDIAYLKKEIRLSKYVRGKLAKIKRR
jgi:glycosyltransferase involved in cell wall biosynthesis